MSSPLSGSCLILGQLGLRVTSSRLVDILDDGLEAVYLELLDRWGTIAFPDLH